MNENAYIEQFYLVGAAENLLVAVAVEEQQNPQWAELIIPYHDPDGKVYGITCYLNGIPNHAIVLGGMIELQQHARLLALRGKGGVDQFENVVAVYKYGAQLSDEVQAFCQFSRPQDFAVRGLYDDAPAWKYRLINYIVTGDMEIPAVGMGPLKLNAGTSYIVNAWIDVPTSDVEMMQQFVDVFPMMSMRGAPDEVRPMRPTDCLQEDDFWDRDKLGTPPADCPDEPSWED